MNRSTALAPWNIQPSKRVEDSLRYYRADKAVIGNYARLTDGLENSDDPASIGVQKKGRHKGCLGAHVTKSAVLVYRIDYPEHRIDLMWMGDHKKVYRRDS